MNRIELAKRYCQGLGLEIGALCFPWPNVRTHNMDYVSAATLRAQYKEHQDKQFKNVDIIDSAETCEQVKDNTYRFLVSSHNLEHMENPIGALQNWVRVVKTGGHLVMAVPHKDHCFDRDRDVTTLRHLVDDFLYPEYRESQREKTYREYLSKVDKLAGDRLEESVKWCMGCNYNIHFHTFTTESVSELSCLLESTGSVVCRELVFKGHEIFWVLEKKKEATEWKRVLAP